MNEIIATATANHKTLTDGRIANLNTLRDTPCVTENGECWIVQAVRAYVDSATFRVDGVADVNVFATEGEARKFAAEMTERADDGDSCVKRMYTVRYRHVDL